MAWRWRSCGLVFALLFLLAGTGSAAARSLTKTLVAGPLTHPAAKQLDFDAFFRRQVTVHVGDSVRWQIHGFHTITFPGRQPPPPLFLPAANDPITGATDSAGASFWFNGVPNLHANPMAAFPSGSHSTNGSQFVNSGLPPGAPGQPVPPFTVRFTKAGTFRYLCLVHPGMTGSVKVVSSRRPIPTKAQDRAAAGTEYAKANRLASRLVKVHPGALRVLAGNDAGGVAWLRFFPLTLHVRTGQTVTFQNTSRPEVHTVTFGPESYTKPIEDSFTTVKPNPAGPPTVLVNPLAAYPSDPPSPNGLPPYNGMNHGNGFENTGLIDNDPHTPAPPKAAITFTKPGTYRYECVIHQNMDGTIVVS